MIAKDEPCLGPVTADSCGTICPKLGCGCYGCFGALKYANLDAMTNKSKINIDSSVVKMKYLKMLGYKL